MMLVGEERESDFDGRGERKSDVDGGGERE